MRYCQIEDMEECLAEHHESVAAVIMECLHGAIKYFYQILFYFNIANETGRREKLHTHEVPVHFPRNQRK